VPGDVPHTQKDSRHEGGAVEGIVAEGELFPRSPEQDFLVRHEAAEPDTVDAHAVDVTAPGTRELARGCIRAGIEAGICTLPGDELGSTDRGA
jgi:hypothetical protein